MQLRDFAILFITAFSLLVQPAMAQDTPQPDDNFNFYDFEEGVRRDLSNDRKFYRSSAHNYTSQASSIRLEFRAKQGNVRAQFELASIHYIKNRIEEAIDWFGRAAEQGLARAQYNLGYMYNLGEGVKQDYELAHKWYLNAARQGYASATNNLGYMYEAGEGVEINYEKAHMYYSLSAAQGDKGATKNRDALLNLMTPEQIRSSQKLSREW